jgi:hypothetical protein
MYFTDGTIYKGNWSRGLQTGKATMSLPDGTFKEGFFSNNIFYGDNSPEVDDRSNTFRSPMSDKVSYLSKNSSNSSLIDKAIRIKPMNNKKNNINELLPALD